MFGILTIHHGVNEGSLWQASCVARSLAPAEIVDYRHPSRENMYRVASTSPRALALNRYREENLPISDRLFRGLEPRGLVEHINANYHALVVGSDEVWRVHFDSEGKQKKLSHPEAPNAYWPPKEIDRPIFGVAVSTGGATLENAPKTLIHELARRVDRFSIIGVRDEITHDTLLKLAPSLCNRLIECPDPTWVYESPPKDVQERVRSWLAHSDDLAGRRMLILEPDQTHVRKSLKDIVEHSKYRPIALGDCGIPEGVTPPEFVALIQQVDCVASVRMHALIACLKAETPCLSLFPRPKILELRKRFQLPEGDLDAICRDWPVAQIKKTRQLLAKQVRAVFEMVRR